MDTLTFHPKTALWVLFLCIWLAAGVALLSGCEDPAGTSEANEVEVESCPTYSLGIAPIPSLTTYLCGPTGAATQNIMNRLNAFWGSDVQACSCQADAFAFGSCQGNGFVLPSDVGVIYFDANFLDQVDAATGSPAAADWFMGHEFGHNVQLGLNLSTFGQQTELQADCLSGYFIGYEQCTGEADEQDALRALQLACQVGDPFTSPFWASGTHGTCAQRMAATRQGFEAYRAGLLPGQACP